MSGSNDTHRSKASMPTSDEKSANSGLDEGAADNARPSPFDIRADPVDFDPVEHNPGQYDPQHDHLRFHRSNYYAPLHRKPGQYVHGRSSGVFNPAALNTVTVNPGATDVNNGNKGIAHQNAPNAKASIKSSLNPGAVLLGPLNPAAINLANFNPGVYSLSALDTSTISLAALNPESPNLTAIPMNVVIPTTVNTVSASPAAVNPKEVNTETAVPGVRESKHLSNPGAGNYGTLNARTVNSEATSPEILTFGSVNPGAVSIGIVNPGAVNPATMFNSNLDALGRRVVNSTAVKPSALNVAGLNSRNVSAGTVDLSAICQVSSDLSFVKQNICNSSSGNTTGVQGSSESTAGVSNTASTNSATSAVNPASCGVDAASTSVCNPRLTMSCVDGSSVSHPDTGLYSTCLYHSNLLYNATHNDAGSNQCSIPLGVPHSNSFSAFVSHPEAYSESVPSPGALNANALCFPESDSARSACPSRQGNNAPGICNVNFQNAGAFNASLSVPESVNMSSNSGSFNTGQLNPGVSSSNSMPCNSYISDQRVPNAAGHNSGCLNAYLRHAGAHNPNVFYSTGPYNTEPTKPSAFGPYWNAIPGTINSGMTSDGITIPCALSRCNFGVNECNPRAFNPGMTYYNAIYPGTFHPGALPSSHFA